MTSRNRLRDAIEYIANNIALCSHTQELLNNLHWEYEVAHDDKIADEIKMQKLILDVSMKTRRAAMKHLVDTFPSWDDRMWCSAKHAIAWWMYATECKDWSNDNFWLSEQQTAYDLMVMCVSKLLDDPLDICWRCKQDKNLTNNI